MLFAMRRTRWALNLLVIIALFYAPAAGSAAVLAPPGHSGSDQYFETIPTSAGNSAPPGSVKGSGTASATPQALSRLGQGRTGDSRLAKLGTAGQAAAMLAASTAPARVDRSAAHKDLAGSPGPGSVSNGIGDALASSNAGGVGLLLPILLATAGVVAVALVASRLRRHSGSAPPAT
jgi:hypothetical protein